MELILKLYVTNWFIISTHLGDPLKHKDSIDVKKVKNDKTLSYNMLSRRILIVEMMLLCLILISGVAQFGVEISLVCG